MTENRNVFDKIIDFLNNFENSFVNLLAKIIPILVPLIPAYVSYQHVLRELDFHVFFAWTYGLVVEGLGYAAIYKALQFWEWNKRFQDKKKHSPFLLAIVIYVLYLFVILWVNVLLDWQSGVVWFKVVAVASISLLSVPAGILVSISAIHTERVRENNDLKRQLKDARDSKKNSVNNNREEIIEEDKSDPSFHDWRRFKDSLTLEQKEDFVKLNKDQRRSLAKKWNVTEKTILNRIGYVKKELGISDEEVVNPLDTFIEQMGRFPSDEELRQIGMPVEDVSRYVVENSQVLLDGGLISQDLISMAEERLNS